MITVAEGKYTDDARRVETTVFNEKVAEFDDTALCRIVNIPDGEERAVASLSLFDFDVNFDGTLQKLLAVGGVCTLPEYRYKGYSAELMKEALRYMYKNGYTLSMLRPFSTAFYRKYGYVPIAEYAVYRIKTESLSVYEKNYEVCEMTDADRPKLRELERSFYRDCNLCCPDEFYGMADQYRYTVKDENGKIRGFTAFELNGHNNDNIEVSNLVYDGYKSLSTLLFILHSFLEKGYTRATVSNIPECYDLFTELSEHRDGAVNREIGQYGMGRVVNVEKALELCVPRAPFEAVIKINDGIIEENDRTFRLSSDGGKVAYEITDLSPDAEIDAGAFSSLILGRNHSSEIPMLPGVTLHCEKEKLYPIFYKKPILLNFSV